MIKSPCHRERQRYLGWKIHVSMDFIPQCTADGIYKPKQCNSSHCWCVDSHGYELPETLGLKDEDFDCSNVTGMSQDFWSVFASCCRI